MSDSKFPLTRVILALIVVGVLVAIGAIPRVARARKLNAEAASADANGVPVLVTTVHQSAATPDLALPGTVLALHEASVYAQTSGYVSRWVVDMGAHVHAGQVMATISTPEVDQQLEAARATLARARAATFLAQTNLARWKTLVSDSAVSKLELDERQEAYDDAAAAQLAAQADVKRLTALHDFAQIVAPFSGVVTSRGLDVGTYVSPPGTGTNATSGTASSINRGLYSMAQLDTVRLLVNVPQTYAGTIAIGQPADVLVQERPGRVFKGVVSRTSGALDPASRTLLVEVRIVNRDEALVPGLYAQVHFHVSKGADAPLLVTANALVTRSDGPQVVEVRPGGTAHFQRVELGRDYGSEVELAAGAVAGDTVVTNPSDDVIEGARLRIVRPPPAPEH
jgi:RND family efflux transporter MFP subunit